MAPKEEELRLPPLETAIELLMVDMRLPAASLHRFRFSLSFARCILYYGVTHRQMNKDGMRTPVAALSEIDHFFALAASFTCVTPGSIWLTSAEAGVPVKGVVW